MFLASLFLVAFARSLASPISVAIPGTTIPSPVCAIAAAVTASQCDPARTRTIFDILYSCIGVILLCTYISIHHNIPDQEDSGAKVTWLKLRTTLYALAAPEMVIMWAIRQRIMARRIAEGNSHRKWTKTHGFFIQMGGLVRQKEVEGKLVYEVVCNPDDLTKMKIPYIPEKEIQDHGKGDFLAKALVVIQTTWFVAQCIARRVEGLVLTEIELVTLAFATLNVITYGLWWNKPLNIGYPIYFDENGIRVDGPLSKVDEPADGSQIKEWKGAWYSRIWSSVSECVGEACQDTWEDMKESWKESLRRRGVMRAIWDRVIVGSFLVVFGPLWDTMTDVNTENRPTSVHPFNAASMSNHDTHLAIILGSVIGVVFGAIHLIGWNFRFPTLTELWLWRASSLVVAIVPVFLTVGAALDTEYTDNMLLLVTLFVGPPLYLAARIVLLFLAFFTLRDLPDSAYQNVRWTDFIPHI